MENPSPPRFRKTLFGPIQPWCGDVRSLEMAAISSFRGFFPGSGSRTLCPYAMRMLLYPRVRSPAAFSLLQTGPQVSPLFASFFQMKTCLTWAPRRSFAIAELFSLIESSLLSAPMRRSDLFFSPFFYASPFRDPVARYSAQRLSPFSALRTQIRSMIFSRLSSSPPLSAPKVDARPESSNALPVLSDVPWNTVSSSSSRGRILCAGARHLPFFLEGCGMSNALPFPSVSWPLGR